MKVNLILSLLFLAQLSIAQTHLKVDSLVRNYVDYHDIPGAAVAVVKDGKVIHQNYYGLASIEWSAPVDEATLFRVYSTTKIMANVALFQLQERGLLNVHDPIGKYLDNIPEDWKTRTISHLQSHASGLPDFVDLDWQLSEEELLDKLSTMDLEYEPGTRFKYNQTNYWLIKNIIEKVSGQSMNDFIIENQFDGEDRSIGFSSDVADVIKNRTTSYRYDRSKKVYHAGADRRQSYGHAANGMHISLPAFIDWARAFGNKELLNEVSIKGLTTYFPYKEKTNRRFMAGIEEYPVNGKRSIGFTGGGVSGYRYFPKYNMSIIYLSNGFKTRTIHNKVIDQIAGLVERELYNQNTVAQEKARQYVDTNPDVSASTILGFFDFSDPNLLDGSLNSIGYWFLNNGKLDDAITIFQKNVQLFPDVANVHDSLGEAYLAQEEYGKAKSAYAKAIALGGTEGNAVKMLKGIEERLKKQK